MKRIGLAASKIAKGNLWFYNFYVVLIAFLFSLFIFVISGSAVMIALIAIAYVANIFTDSQYEKNWSSILTACMVSLTVITVIFNLLAISKNIKLTKRSD